MPASKVGRHGLEPRRSLMKKCPQCELEFANGRGLHFHLKSHARNAVEAYTSPGGRRQYLLKTRGHRCENCGLSEWMGQPIPITMEHIDGNSDNNVDSNLKLLCPNCHAQTPTFAGKNKGRFITKRNSYRAQYRMTT